MRLEGKLPSLAELRAYVDLSGYSNAAWKFRMREGWVRQLLDEQPGPKLSELLPVSVTDPTPRPAPVVGIPITLTTLPPKRPPAPPDAPALPRKPAAPITDQERAQVVAALRSAGRPLSKSLLLCHLRGWNVERVGLTLTDLLATDALYSPATGRYGVHP